MSDRDDVATELRRVVDRLNSLPLAKVEPHLPTCHDMALFIVERTWELDATVPADVTLPTVGAGAAGAQLAVVGRDYLAAAEASHVSDLTAVGDRLVALRRSLP